MNVRLIFVVLPVLALTAIGAGCTSTTSVTTDNANSTGTGSTNVSSGSNTNATGTFSTNTSVSTNSAVINATVNSSVTAQTATVTITSAGVSPQNITVDRSTQVKFVNNDSQSHQIASDPHPVHTDLSGFDNKIRPGETYTFTFGQVGTWGYHDHDNPFSAKLQGKVIVK